MTRLIDAEALKKKLQYVYSCEYIGSKSKEGIVSDIIEDIDNAPTVEPHYVSDLPDDVVKTLQTLAIDYSEGIAIFERKRPQGEWITKNLEKPYGKCNQCGEICEVDNYCGNCGADMQKGGAV